MASITKRFFFKQKEPLSVDIILFYTQPYLLLILKNYLYNQ